METQDIVIISLTILVVYFLYQQNNQTNFASLTSENQEKITKLQQEVQHYKNLYQRRVEKDLEADQTTKIAELTNQLTQLETKYRGYEEKEVEWQGEREKLVSELKKVSEESEVKITELTKEVQTEKETNTLYQQKIEEQDKALLNLARQKIKGKKEAEKLLKELEVKWNKDKEVKLAWLFCW